MIKKRTAKGLSKKQRMMLLEKARYMATITGQYSEAIEVVNTLFAVNGEDIDALKLKGNILDLSALGLIKDNMLREGRQQFEEARTYYEQILKLDTNNIPALVDMGDYWRRSEKPEMALAYYGKAINLLKQGFYYISRNDEIEEAFYAKSELLRAIGKNAEAEECRIEGLQLCPSAELLRL